MMGFGIWRPLCLSLHPPLKVCLFNFKLSEYLIMSHGSSSAHAQKSAKLLLCNWALFKCSVEQSHSGWIQHRPCWKGLLPTFSHRQTKLVSLVPDPCQRRHTIPGRLPERKFENTIWAEQRWIKQVLLSPVKSIEFVSSFMKGNIVFKSGRPHEMSTQSKKQNKTTCHIIH